MTRRIIIAITGASGAIYGIRALELLRTEAPDVESHLILSTGGRATIAHETSRTSDEVRALADVVHPDSNLGASIASGSFETAGMLVAPCSVKTLSAVANSYDANLVARAADVVLKESRPLVLLLRETPLHVGHLRLMLTAAEIGAIVMPPVPGFYHRPESVEQLVDHTVARSLEQLGVKIEALQRWEGSVASPRRDEPLESLHD